MTSGQDRKSCIFLESASLSICILPHKIAGLSSSWPTVAHSTGNKIKKLLGTTYGTYLSDQVLGE